MRAVSALLLLATPTFGLKCRAPAPLLKLGHVKRHAVSATSPDEEMLPSGKQSVNLGGRPNIALPTALMMLTVAAPAEAASVPNALPSAFAAYGHYLGLFLTVACLAVERVTIKEGMTEEDFDIATAADAVYGLAGLLVVGTGYLRVTQYGKGWEFYQHEVRCRSNKHAGTDVHTADRR